MRTILTRILTGAALSLALAPLTSAHAVNGVIHGKVIHVEDGDTLVLLDQDRQRHKIRLADIDAPETCHAQHDPGCRKKPGQPFGDRARQALADWTRGKAAVAACRGVVSPGRDDRLVCYVTVGEPGPRADSVNYRLVGQGYAWVEKRFAKDPELFALGENARSARLGLWAMPHPVEPRHWRQRCWRDGDCPQ